MNALMCGMACIDRRDHRKRIVGRDERRGKGSERRQTDGRLASRESNSPRRGDSDAQAREAAGPGGHCDTIKISEVELRALQDSRNERHQCLGVPALHRQRFLQAQIRARCIEHGDRTGFECGIDGQNAHSAIVALNFVATGPVPVIRGFCRGNCDYIGRTSTTSGTKWRSRFWIPCFRVAVEDGQPEQAPFILRYTMPSL